MSSERTTRASFNKDRVGKYEVGPTGITAMNIASATPTAELKVTQGNAGDLNYDATEILYRNLDSLGEKLMQTNKQPNREAVEDIQDYKESSWDDVVEEMNGLEEDQVVQNLNRYIGVEQKNSGQKTKPPREAKRSDNFCRHCGCKYLSEDNFCGNCGEERLK